MRRPKPGCGWPRQMRKRFVRFVDPTSMWELICEARDVDRFLDLHDERRQEFYVVDLATGTRHAGARGFTEN